MTAAADGGSDSSDMGKVILRDLVFVLWLRTVRHREEWKVECESMFKGKSLAVTQKFRLASSKLPLDPFSSRVE